MKNELGEVVKGNDLYTIEKKNHNSLVQVYSGCGPESKYTFTWPYHIEIERHHLL